MRIHFVRDKKINLSKLNNYKYLNTNTDSRFTNHVFIKFKLQTSINCVFPHFIYYIKFYLILHFFLM